MTYTLPDGAHLVAAVEHAAELQTSGATGPELARIACLLMAAVVRDSLTDYDHTADFDAVELELAAYSGTADTVEATGTYWTAAGKPLKLDPHDVFELNAWACKLCSGNGAGWEPLCTLLTSGARTRYRLDLAHAAEAVHLA